MFKKDKKNKSQQAEDKPWESQFDDDRDDKGNLSRVASKSKEKGNTYFALILGALLVLVIAAPIIAYTVHSSRANRPTVDSSNDIVVSNSHKDASSSKKLAASKQKASEKSASEKAVSESKAKVASSKSASEKSASESAVNASQAAVDSQNSAASASSAALASQQAASSSVAEAASSSSAAAASSSSAASESSASSSSTGTYTLKSGEGLYRAAVNNGMTLSELLALNPGLTSSSSVAPGTTLNIK